MKIGLETIVSHFPENVVTREDYSYLDPVIPEDLKERFRGADQLRRNTDEDAAESMGEIVARKALDSAGLKTSDIDFIIAGSFGGKYVFPLVGTWIHHALGFSDEVPVLNMQNCCAGFVDGCHVAESLIRSGMYKRVLVVMVTAWMARGSAIDPTGPMIKNFGDGSGAAIVSSQNLKCEFLSYHNRTVGELYNHMCFSLKPNQNPELTEISGAKTDMGNYLWADDWFFGWQEREGKSYAIDVIEKAVKKANLTLSDVDKVVIHQADYLLYDNWMKGGEERGVSKDKWKETYHKYANIGNVDIAPNLVELWESGEIKNGSILAFFAPGAGGHTPCMIIRWLV